MLQDKDRVIIECLRSVGARKKLAQISAQADIPVSTLHDRLTKLLERGQARLVTLLNYRKLRIPLQSWVFVQATNREETRSYLLEHPNINTLLYVNNGADFCCEAVFSDFAEYYRFLEKLERFGAVTDHPIIEEVCKENARVAT